MPDHPHSPAPSRARVRRGVALAGIALLALWNPVLRVLLGGGADAAVWVASGVFLAFGLSGRGGERGRGPIGWTGRVGALLFVAFWLLWGATLPHSTAWAPGSKEVVREVQGMAQAGVVALAALLLTHGRPWAGRVWDRAWAAMFVSVLPLVAVELTLDRHVVLTGSGRWRFGPHVPVGAFVNPNDLACFLLVAIGVFLAWGRPRRAVPPAPAIAAAVAGTAVILPTNSRAALGGALLFWAVFAVGVVRDDPRAAGLRTRLATPAARVAAGAAVAAVVVASVTVPALAARNPLLRMLVPGDDVTRASDGLRVALTRAGLRYWAERPLLGTGAGSFETLLAQERPADVSVLINMHDAFVELLSQYGLLVCAPLFAMLAWCAWWCVRRPYRPAATDTAAGSPAWPSHLWASPDAPGPSRMTMAFLLVGVVALGLTVSSAVPSVVWWLAMAHLAVLADDAAAARAAARVWGRA